MMPTGTAKMEIPVKSPENQAAVVADEAYALLFGIFPIGSWPHWVGSSLSVFLAFWSSRLHFERSRWRLPDWVLSSVCTLSNELRPMSLFSKRDFLAG